MGQSRRYFDFPLFFLKKWPCMQPKFQNQIQKFLVLIPNTVIGHFYRNQRRYQGSYNTPSLYSQNRNYGDTFSHRGSSQYSRNSMSQKNNWGQRSQDDFFSRKLQWKQNFVNSKLQWKKDIFHAKSNLVKTIVQPKLRFAKNFVNAKVYCLM